MVGTYIGCTRLYGLLTCVGSIFRVRCKGRYVPDVLKYVGGRSSRHGAVGRGDAFWNVYVWARVGSWALCLGIWL